MPVNMDGKQGLSALRNESPFESHSWRRRLRRRLVRLSVGVVSPVSSAHQGHGAGVAYRLPNSPFVDLPVAEETLAARSRDTDAKVPDQGIANVQGFFSSLEGIDPSLSEAAFRHSIRP